MLSEIDVQHRPLLPCNVVVSAEGDRSKLQIVDPQTMSGVTGADDLQPAADEASARSRQSSTPLT